MTERVPGRPIESPADGDDTAFLPPAKLNATLVRRIRRQHREKEEAKRQLDEQFSTAAFAKRYGVAPSTITKVLTYATWRHVRDE